MGVKRGDRVSLNTEKRLYFFQDGEGGIRLSVEQNEMAIIPVTATDVHLSQINQAIDNGHLVVGWTEKKTEELDKDSDIQKLLESGRNKVDEWIYAIREDKTMKSGEKVSKLERLLELEKAGKNRKSVVKIAESTLNTIGGISSVEEVEKTKIEIPVIFGNSETLETK